LDALNAMGMRDALKAPDALDEMEAVDALNGQDPQDALGTQDVLDEMVAVNALDGLDAQDALDTQGVLNTRGVQNRCFSGMCCTRSVGHARI
jgi:hypothetical protein